MLTLGCSSFARSLAPLLAIAFVVAATGACGAAPDGADDSADTNQDALMSTTVHTSYGMTTFGGAGDSQRMACGQNSSTSQPYYVASSQRYGCNVHLQIVAANGKCIVVQTEDAGPASSVETRAGEPIIDAGPKVAQYLFGTTSLGWSDNKAHKAEYAITVTRTAAPLGPCTALVNPLPSTGPGSLLGGGSTAGGSSGTTSSVACRSDGDCSPGDDGSGQICVSSKCIAGCHTNAQCPGSETCHAGTCR